MSSGCNTHRTPAGGPIAAKIGTRACVLAARAPTARATLYIARITFTILPSFSKTKDISPVLARIVYITQPAQNNNINTKHTYFLHASRLSTFASQSVCQHSIGITHTLITTTIIYRNGCSDYFSGLLNHRSSRSSRSDNACRRILFEFGVEGYRISRQNVAHCFFALFFVFARIVTRQTTAINTAVELNTEALAVQFETPRLFARASHVLNLVSMVRLDFCR